MTATTAEYSSSPKGILLGMLALLLMGFTIALVVVYNDHAVERHGIAEVTAVRTCFENGGENGIWQSNTDRNKFYRTCKLDDGRFGIQILQDKIAHCVERTCFIFEGGKGTWTELTKYLSRFASKYKGIVINW